MFGDGTRIVIEETAERRRRRSSSSPADAAAWVELGERSQPVLKAFGLASEGWVPPPAVANGFARLVAGRSADPLIELTQLSVAELVTRWFENPYVRAMAMFRSVFSGLAPWTPGSAAAFLLTVAGHGRRAGRPCRWLPGARRRAVRGRRGGWGHRALRLRRGVRAPGGLVVVGPLAPARWWPASSRRCRQACSCSTCSTEMSRRAPRDRRPASRRSPTTSASSRSPRRSTMRPCCLRSVERISTPPPCGCCQIRWLPRRSARPRSSARSPDRRARSSRSPAAPMPLSPEGSATMWANAPMPRRLAGRPGGRRGRSRRRWWHDRRLPSGIRSCAVHEVLTSPEALTALTGAENAGSHVAPTLRQTLGRRPASGLGNYRTPMEGIYLSGAGTHPGSSVSGAPGRACARVILDDVGLAGRRLDRPQGWRDRSSLPFGPPAVRSSGVSPEEATALAQVWPHESAGSDTQPAHGGTTLNHSETSAGRSKRRPTGREPRAPRRAADAAPSAAGDARRLPVTRPSAPPLRRRIKHARSSARRRSKSAAWSSRRASELRTQSADRSRQAAWAAPPCPPSCKR